MDKGRIVTLPMLERCMHILLEHDEGFEVAGARHVQTGLFLVSVNRIDIGQRNRRMHNFILYINL